MVEALRTHVPLDSKLTCLWVAAQAAGVARDDEIAKADVLASKGLGTLTCDLSKPTNGFPVGAYRVDLLVNGQKTHEVRCELADSAPVVARRARQPFIVVNSAGYAISDVRDEELDDGVEKAIRFNRLEKTCVRDLKTVVSEDGSKAIWSDINLCKTSTVTIKYDRKRDKTTAVFD